MKLNPDCIRDVMMTLEEELSIFVQECGHNEEIFRFQPMRVERLILKVNSEYEHSKPDIVYSVLQLVENGYIVMDGDSKIRGRFNRIILGDILYITPKGHEFVSSIQNKKDWAEKICPILKKVGSVSLYIIEAVSKGVTTAAIGRLISSLDS